MKLYLTATSERGKPVTKSGNEEINITLTNDRRQKFDISFKGDSLKVMRYYDASVETIDYMPCHHDWDNYGKCTICGKWNVDNGECAVCNAPLGQDRKCPYGC